MILTRKQRQTLKERARWYDTTYRALRRNTVPTIGCDNAIAVRIYDGFWLCIETDGYAHS